MKRTLFLCACILFLTTKTFAEIYAIKISADNFTYYSTPSSPESPGNVYYRHAIENETNKVITTGFIIVQYNGPDIDVFTASNGLQVIQKIAVNRYLFKNTSDTGDVELCAGLWETSGVVFAVPQFESRKQLQ